MYTDTPEQFLQSKGLLYPIEKKKLTKAVEEKHHPNGEPLSPRTEHELKIEDLKTAADIEEKKWKSCCFQLEPESSVFFAKLIVSILTIILCSYQLISLEGCNYQSLYSSILSSIITYWLSNKK